MLRSLPSAIDDALYTLYEPNAVFSQFLGSASMTFFFSFPFLASSSCLVFSCFSCLLFSFLSCFVFFVRFLLFSFISFLFLFVLRFFFPIVLRLSCVCVVIDTTCNIYVVFLGWQAVQSVFPSASN